MRQGGGEDVIYLAAARSMQGEGEVPMFQKERWRTQTHKLHRTRRTTFDAASGGWVMRRGGGRSAQHRQHALQPSI